MLDSTDLDTLNRATQAIGGRNGFVIACHASCYPAREAHSLYSVAIVGRCQAVEATESVSSLVKTSRGVRKPRTARGRSLSSSAMASR